MASHVRTILCMLRAVVLGLLAVSAAAACSGGRDAPQVQPGVAAGTIVELAGTVTATRGTATRTLGVSDVISGDDVIQTGADGHVLIALTHNNARWELGPNKQQQVSGSLAWSLARQAPPATNVTETTTAAGRHAEKSGADTASTSATTGMSAPAAEPVAAAATEERARAGGADLDEGAPREAAKEMKAPPASKASPASTASSASKGAPRTQPRAALAPSAPRPPPPAPTGGTRAPATAKLEVAPSRQEPENKESRERRSSPVVSGAPGAPAAPADGLARDDAPVADASTVASQIRVVLARDKARINACLASTAPGVAVTLSVKQGKARFVTAPAVPASVTSCLAAIASKLVFRVVDETTTVRFTR